MRVYPSYTRSSNTYVTTGWVDVMPQTEFGVWFALFYALAGSILIYVRAHFFLSVFLWTLTHRRL